MLIQIVFCIRIYTYVLQTVPMWLSVTAKDQKKINKGILIFNVVLRWLFDVPRQI
jgi:hypothetical protein